MEASAPVHPQIEPEPPGWQPRALWVGMRLFCGSVTFFFLSFVFAYFYLRALNPNHDWTIGHVSAPIGWGVAIVVVFVLSAVLFRFGARRPTLALPMGVAAAVLGLVGIALQCVEYTTLGFGPASGGYASVFTGWTALYTLFALCGIYAIETQAASVWRARREGIQRTLAEGVPSEDVELMEAGLEAASFYWAFYVGIGFLAFVLLYLVGT
jgi:heme/copper-type cytochrome/quinol oxidase subunit 3